MQSFSCQQCSYLYDNDVAIFTTTMGYERLVHLVFNLHTNIIQGENSHLLFYFTTFMFCPCNYGDLDYYGILSWAVQSAYFKSRDAL